MNEHLENLFPTLSVTAYRVTSLAEETYNCIAWAAGDNTVPWWPADPEVAFWPEGVVGEETLDAFHQAFATLGYGLCASAELEPGFEKVALFANQQGFPTHAARQLPTGLWTSKLGVLEDIEHSLLLWRGRNMGQSRPSFGGPLR